MEEPSAQLLNSAVGIGGSAVVETIRLPLLRQKADVGKTSKPKETSALPF
jgi:hypothetical protein